MRGRLAFGIWALALAYSIALLVAGPVLADEGPWTLAIFVQPLLFTLVMLRLLRSRCQTGSPAATAVGWAVALLFLGWSVFAGFSLAAGALPAAALLFAATWVTPSGAPRAAGA